MAGQGQAPARQAVFKGGLPQSAGAVTLSKMCGSGMKAAMFAHDMLLAGSHDVMIAGGMESMTNAPYLLLKGRGGMRIGHDRVYDHMMLDGLEDANEPGRAKGTFGEECAAHYQFTRDAQDAFATASVQRAKAATASGAFATEITPVSVKGRAGEVVVAIDEGPGKVKLDKIPTLKPAFQKDGTITAASSSSINDGAAALVMMRASTAARLGARPLARIVSHAMHAQAPNWFTTAPVGATQKALAKAGWKIDDVELVARPLPLADVAVDGRQPVGRFLEEVRPDDDRYCIDPPTRRGLQAMRRQAPTGFFTAMEIAYVLTTGANWHGPIGRFRMTLDKGRPENILSLCWSGLRRTGPTRFEFEARDWTPDRDVRLLILAR
jgi:hypothetical protein